MDEEQYCDIEGRRIPIVMEDRQGRAIPAAIRWFAGSDAGAREAYSFWAVLAGPVPLFVFRTVEGRSLRDRLRDHTGMTPRQIELLQKFAARVMPATADEIKLWLDTYPEEASSLEDSAPAAAS